MHCSACGTTIEAGARFCPTCGAAVAPPAPVRERPFLISVLAILKIVSGVFWLSFAMLSFAISREDPEDVLIGNLIGGVLVALAVAAAVCAYGLLKLAPYGRVLQIALSCFGLLFFPVGTVISALILIYMFQPGIRILFSARAPETWTPEEAERVRAVSKSGLAMAVAVALGVVALMVPFAGIVAAIAIPNLLNAIDRGKQKRTMADIRAISLAVEAYGLDHNAYPSADSAAALAAELAPKYMPTMPQVDGWSHPLQVESGGTEYKIYSFGKDGTGSSCEPAVTINFQDEICFQNGQFVRYPSGTRTFEPETRTTPDGG